MPTRIEIELTSSAPDGSWTWRAAGAREPRGVLDGSILPGGSSVGDQLRVETEHDVDGIRVLSVVPPKEKASRSGVLELLPAEETFEPVVQQRATRERSDADRGPRRPRRDRGERDDGRERRPRTDRGPRSDRSGGGGGDRPHTPHPDHEANERRRQRPRFTPPPEVPQRPKPKRLRPGKQRRAEVLASLPEEQRPVAELAVQGISAVRQRLREDNARLKAEGKPLMPEAAVLKMAEELIPRLRVADWLDRAEAAQRQLDHLDLRDLRSVVAAADDPAVARDESTRALAAELKQALATKQEEELTLWLGDVEVALDVGRVVRALRLSSVPPKAGVPFPAQLATRLAEATTASLQPADGPDRWSAVLEAAAFSPVRSLVTPPTPPEQRSDELMATVRRLAPLLPQVAAIFDVTVAANAPVPKPLRPAPRRPEPKKAARPPAPAPARATPSEPAAAASETAPVTEVEAAPEAESVSEADSAPATQADPAPEPEPETQEEPATQAEPATLSEPAPEAEAEPETPAEPVLQAESAPEAASAPEDERATDVGPVQSGIDADPVAGDGPSEDASVESRATDGEPERDDSTGADSDGHGRHDTASA